MANMPNPVKRYFGKITSFIYKCDFTGAEALSPLDHWQKHQYSLPMSNDHVTSTQKTLLKDIESFLRRHDMPDTTFGLRAVNDGKLVQRLRDGKSGITIRKFDRIHAFMRDYERGLKKNDPARVRMAG